MKTDGVTKNGWKGIVFAMVEQGEEKLLPQRMAASISVIIPVLNEQDNIFHCLQQGRKGGGPVEIIVVDGGSTDQTLSLVSPLVDSVMCGEKGRGTQLNQGANLFLAMCFFFSTPTHCPLRATTPKYIQRWNRGLQQALSVWPSTPPAWDCGWYPSWPISAVPC
jgi:hypothetical protein